MKLLPFILLLAPFRDDLDKHYTALTEAFAGFDRAAADRAAAAIARINDERCPEAFAAAYRSGVTLFVELEKEQKRWAKEMAANELYRDRDNRVVSRGETAKFFAAQKQFNLVAPKVDALNLALPRTLTHLSRLTSPATVKGLAGILATTPDWPLRAACADALGRIADPAALEALLARAKVEDSAAVRVALADALGLKSKESEAARKVLLSWLENPFWQVRIAAAQGLARSGDRKGAVPPLIAALRNAGGRLRQEFNECLKTLTGVDKHGEFTAWKDWWEKNEEALLGGTYVIKPFERADDRGITSFYGVPFYSSRVIFIIDTSTSMNETGHWKTEPAGDGDKPEGDRRIDMARFELRKIIRQMPENALFNVVSVAYLVTFLSDKMVLSSKTTREAAIKFVQGMQIKSGTDLDGALTRSLEFAGGGWNAPLREDSIDTIYFLSDGVPTTGRLDRDRVVDRALDSIRYKKVVIHSIAVDAPPQGKTLMKALSDGSGGHYVER